MIAFFPTPYVDELAYSLFARYHVHSGHMTFRATAEDIFQNKDALSNPEFFPALTEEVCSIISRSSTMETFIAEHTMLPYYIRFLPLERRQRAMERLIAMDRTFYDAIYVRKKKSKQRQYMRYCPLCAAADREQYGETYWHRKHQLPGVEICLEHRCRLENSSNGILSDNQRFKLIHAELVIPENTPVNLDVSDLEYQLSDYVMQLFDADMDFEHDVSVGKFLQSRLEGTPYTSTRGEQVFARKLYPVDKYSVFDELLECYNGKKLGFARMITTGANAVSDIKDFRFAGIDIRKSITASDIKELVKSWMCGFVLCEMDKYTEEHHEDISKLYLARKVIPAPERVYNDVGFMCERLVLDKKANRLVDEQYRNFTWESVIKGSDAQKSQETIDELRGALDSCQQKLKTANESLDICREKIAGLQKKTAIVKDSSELGHIERRYENMLAERDEEIARLQRELTSREQYIEIISAPVSDSKNEQTINPDIMYTKKYLFVGVIRDEFVELKRKFPNSIFMETAQYNPSNVKVDMIVYLIPSMTHALFYKVQNTNSLNDVRRIYCNNRSVNNVLLNIYTALMDE